jgi:hypothetical protein
MAQRPTNTPDPTDKAASVDDPFPLPDDPGGAHHKGYSADPDSPAQIPSQDPVPLASEVPGHARKPDQHGAVGRSGRTGGSPGERVTGADR